MNKKKSIEPSSNMDLCEINQLNMHLPSCVAHIWFTFAHIAYAHSHVNCLHLSSSPKHKRRRCHHIINQAYYTFSVYKYPLNRRLCVAKTINSCMVYLCFLINWFCVHCTRCECLRVFAASSDSRFFDAHRVAFGWANHHRLSHPSIRCDWYFQMKSHPMMCFTVLYRWTFAWNAG